MPDQNLIDTQPNSIFQRRQGDSPWLWFLITVGSITTHVALLQFVNAEVLQARLSHGSEAVMPVDFVELPASDSEKSQPEKPVPQKPAAAKQTATKTDSSNSAKLPTSGIGIAETQPQRTIDPNKIQVVGAEPTNKAPQPVPASSPLSDPTDSSELNSSTDERGEGNLTQTVTQTPEAADARETLPSPLRSAIPTPTQSPAVNRSNLNAPPAPTPLITTQTINVPVPDVSGTLPTSTEGDINNNLLAVITNRVTIPSHLTASLTTTPELSEDNQHLLDKVAQPEPEVQRFSSNPTTSPCVVTPEAVQFLGKAVEMKVMTDEAGRVLHTVTQESSDSKAYDDLATCLVQNWRFTPAIARGQPVADDGLVVRIVIDRG